MNSITFRTIIDFLVTQANHKKPAARYTDGLHFIFSKDCVTFRAVRDGATTTVTLTGKMFAGKGGFFMSFDDLYTFRNALKHEDNARVRLTTRLQPLNPQRHSVFIGIGDWFEADLGLKVANLPKTHGRAGGNIRLEDIKRAASSLRPLSSGKDYRYVVDDKRHSAYVELLEPSFGLTSVIQEIY